MKELIDTRTELQEANGKIGELEYETQVLRQKLEEAADLESRLVGTVDQLVKNNKIIVLNQKKNEKLNQSENRYISLIENENELRNEVSRFKATQRDSKGNMMLLENELETVKQENTN
jgi:hypothetical protein